MQSMPPLVIISSPAPGSRPSRRASRPETKSRTPAIPSVAEYCSATPGSFVMTLAAMSASTPVGNVAGSGKPPENVMMSEAPARARIAVISPPPRV